jgi:predicted nucleic acid-binding Zn ribbon protein
MRWGITFLTWVLVAVYYANGCVDYFRVWTNQPRYSEVVLPLMTECAERNSIQLGKATVALVALYFGSGWAITRLRGGGRKSEQQGEDSPDAEDTLS